MMWNPKSEYCTVTTHTQCETVVLNIALPRLTQNMKPSCILLYLHHCTKCYSVTRTQDVKPLFTILYSHDPHRKWNHCVEYCTVTTQALCETVVHIIVISLLTHHVKLLYALLYCHDSHTMLNCCTHYCNITTRTLC